MVIKVPLILILFICYLADVNEEIPTNLTLLYERFIRQMVKRENARKNLSEKIDFGGGWKQSRVIEATAELAFQGHTSSKYEFPTEMPNNIGVTNDSFTCGFLLHKFNFSEVHNAEFLHLSIQEFFRALHYYRLISTNDTTERNSVLADILNPANRDSQFGFFLGFCSFEPIKFQEMLKWLNPTFDDAKMFSLDLSSFLKLLSASLIDCIPDQAELFGRKLATSFDQLDTEDLKIGKTNRNHSSSETTITITCVLTNVI